ncbi:MAG: hypothetical protein U5R06_18180 [candidate division KSB1 bacterium]|nr:hypothetical protein [candidate division KSB1 bacterium]
MYPVSSLYQSVSGAGFGGDR